MVVSVVFVEYGVGGLFPLGHALEAVLVFSFRYSISIGIAIEAIHQI